MSSDIFSFQRSLKHLTILEATKLLFDELNGLGFYNCTILAIPRCIGMTLSGRLWGHTQFNQRLEDLYRSYLCFHDPVFKYFLDGNRDPHFWGKVQYHGKDKLITNLFKFWGATNGVVLPYYCTNIVGILCTCAPGSEDDHNKLINKHGSDAIALGHMYYQHIDANGAVEEMYADRGLSENCIKYLKLKGCGLLDKQAASELQVTLDGVAYYKRQIKAKLKIRDVADAAIIGCAQGWISI